MGNNKNNVNETTETKPIPTVKSLVEAGIPEAAAEKVVAEMKAAKRRETAAAAAAKFAAENGLTSKAVIAFLSRIAGLTEKESGAAAGAASRESAAPACQGVNPLLKKGFSVVILKNGQQVFPPEV